MSSKPPIWAYALPTSLLLMAPFDIFASLAMDIYLPIVPDMPAILQTSPAVIQLTLSLYILTLGLAQLIFGPISDRIGRRPVLLGGGLLFVATSFGIAASSTAATFLVLRCLQAVGASAALVAMFATVRDVYAKRPEGTVIYGLLSSMLAFVPAVGPLIGTLISNALGWRAIFITLGVAATLAVVNSAFNWVETRPAVASYSRQSFRPMIRSRVFWTYTLGFSAAMGSFFVFFSTAPRVLITVAGHSNIQFSLSFASVALVMIVTARFAKRFVARWGLPGTLARGMITLLFGAAIMGVAPIWGAPSFSTFVFPMWIMAVGVVLAVSVTANGALQNFDDVAGSAVALYFCIQSLLVSSVGSLLVITFDGSTVWPLVAYASTMALLVLMALRAIHHRLR